MPLIGQYVPQCEVDGDYSAVQCHASTGHCWCVVRESGEEINGTRVRPGEGKPICGGIYRPKSRKAGDFPSARKAFAERGLGETG